MHHWALTDPCSLHFSDLVKDTVDTYPNAELVWFAMLPATARTVCDCIRVHTRMISRALRHCEGAKRSRRIKGRGSTYGHAS